MKTDEGGSLDVLAQGFPPCVLAPLIARKDPSSHRSAYRMVYPDGCLAWVRCGMTEVRPRHTGTALHGGPHQKGSAPPPYSTLTQSAFGLAWQRSSAWTTATALQYRRATGWLVTAATLALLAVATVTSFSRPALLEKRDLAHASKGTTRSAPDGALEDDDLRTADDKQHHERRRTQCPGRGAARLRASQCRRTAFAPLCSARQNHGNHGTLARRPFAARVADLRLLHAFASLSLCPGPSPTLPGRGASASPATFINVGAATPKHSAPPPVIPRRSASLHKPLRGSPANPHPNIVRGRLLFSGLGFT